MKTGGLAFAAIIAVISATGASTAADRVRYWSPVWSPDGKRIAFVSDRDGSDFGNVFVAAADGGNPRQVTRDNLGKTGVAWSPNGKWIAFRPTRTSTRSAPTERSIDD